MILGFSHVMIGCQFNDNWGAHMDVPSSREKWPLLKNKPTSHDLVVGFPSDNSGMVPIELVRHNTGFSSGRPRISIRGRGWVEVAARDVVAEGNFFNNFGDRHGDVVRVGVAIPNWRVDLSVKKRDSAQIDPPLDILGPSALAFYSTDSEHDKDMLVSAGGRMATEPFAVQIGGVDMLICMLRSQEGTIVELIQVRGRD